MNLLSGLGNLFSSEEEDDPTCLNNPVLEQIWAGPELALNLTRNANPWDFRDKIRLNCLSLLAKDPRSKKQKKPLMNNVPSLFNEMDPPLLSHKMALIAFYLSMKDFRTRLKVDKAQRLKEMLDDDCTLFRGLPQDILHTCRPIECEGIEVDPGVRACGMLSILYLDAETAFENGIPDQKFIFLVSYCLRMHVVKRSMKQFKDLNRMLLRELLMMPGFPGQSELKTYWGTLTAGLQSLATLGLGNSDERGRELSNYAMRVHSSLAARGVFSPRLMEFLGIDVARVFIEEDGRIAKILDTTTLGRGSVWHMVENEWLKKWRKFVLGRGARRYRPPGTINNFSLMQHEVKKDVVGKDGIRRDVRVWKARKEMAVQGEFEEVTERGADGTVNKYTKVKMEPIHLQKHYRAVNFNLWHYWKMVHGGGPCISRKNKEIDSPMRCGYMEAVFRMQCFGRMVIAKQKRDDLYWKNLSRNAKEVRRVLAQAQLEKIEADAKASILEAQEKRQDNKLSDACQFTQRVWRSKKTYEFADTGLKVMKHAQEVFADAEGRIEQATGGQPFVVEETEAILDVGNIEEYDVMFTEDMGLAIGLKKHATSEITFVHSVPHSLTKAGLTAENPFGPTVAIESQLMAINDYPVSSLTHEQVMSRLKKIDWPLRMRFMRPLVPADVKPIDFIVKRVLSTEHGGDDDVKLQALKRLLASGLKLRKHCKSGKPHETTLYINEHLVFWYARDGDERVKKVKMVVEKKAKAKLEKQAEAEAAASKAGKGKGKAAVAALDSSKPLEIDPSKPRFEERGEADGMWVLPISRKYDCTNSLSLYDLKYVRAGCVSKTLKKAKNADKDACFSLFVEGAERSLDFEYELERFRSEKKGGKSHVPLPPGVADVKDVKEARNLLVWGFNKIITEARGSKLFLDKAGNPARRIEPKRRLKILT